MELYYLNFINRNSKLGNTALKEFFMKYEIRVNANSFYAEHFKSFLIFTKNNNNNK